GTTCVRVVDRIESPSLRVDLVLDLEYLQRSDLVPHRARVDVRRLEHLHGDAVLRSDDPAALVGELGSSVIDDLVVELARDYHQTVESTASSSSTDFVQSSADRYFEPSSATTNTTFPSSSSDAMRTATDAIAPDETPAKIPSS